MTESEPSVLGAVAAGLVFVGLVAIPLAMVVRPKYVIAKFAKSRSSVISRASRVTANDIDKVTATEAARWRVMGAVLLAMIAFILYFGLRSG